MKNSFLEDALKKREAENALRSLRVSKLKTDLCSNDYLGFARSEEMGAMAEKEFHSRGVANGSTGSRLISGNTAYAEELEKKIAAFHHAEAGLIFNSGFDANTGLFSCIAKRGDTILADELVHASIIDGMLLSRADHFRFRHNDLDQLEKKLQTAKGNIFVAVESVYSMDGDEAPLKEMVKLCTKYNAQLIVDEAHATGIFGKRGEGLVVEQGSEKNVFARVITFGKALGANGAAVLGSRMLRNYLINFSRPFIYSTALPLHSLCTIRSAYEHLKKDPSAVKKLKKNIDLFRKEIATSENIKTIPSRSAIQSIIIPGNENVRAIASALQKNEFDVRAILHPTVPKGKERIRICLHAFNAGEEISRLCHTLNSLLKEK